MGKSAGKWIKTLLFGKKHSKSNYSKNDKKGELKSAVEDPARDSSLEKGTSASQCDAVGVDQGIDSPKKDELARRQEAAEAEYDAILVSSKQKLPLIDDHKFESGAGLLNTHDSTPQDQGKIDENSPPSDPKNNSDSAVSFEDDVENGLSQRQNKAAFRMSVLEDYVDSDDDLPSIGGSLEAHLTDSKEEPKLFEPTQPKLKSHSHLILSNTNEASPAVAGTDPVQSTAPSLPAFGQASPAPSGFMFGSAAAPSQPNNPFEFGGQQNQAPPPNPSMFQASNSLDFNAGGSFWLGSGGVDKSGRKFVKINRNKNRKK